MFVFVIGATTILLIDLDQLMHFPFFQAINVIPALEHDSGKGRDSLVRSKEI